MSNLHARAQRIQERAERAVAYWIERLADNDVSFVGSDDEERFGPLSELLGDLLERGTSAGDAASLDRAESVADQIEAYSMGAEGIRIRARHAHEDMMARREEEGAPLLPFQENYEALMTLLHAIDKDGSDDLGASLLDARKLLLEMESLAQH